MADIEPMELADQPNFTRFATMRQVERRTDKAFLIQGEWYPISQMRVAGGDLFLADWLYKKKKQEFDGDAYDQSPSEEVYDQGQDDMPF